MIKYLEKENLEDLLKDGFYIVDFYADWCGPCKMLGKVLEELEENIIKVNTDAREDLALKYGIMSIPTIIFFKDGRELKKVVGFQSKEEIINLINKLKWVFNSFFGTIIVCS